MSPNPLVGAVVAGGAAGDEPVTLGEGYHAEVGEAHAERAALAACHRRGADPRGATMFVTLEPCAHHGRQPPCVEAIVDSGIARVVIAAEDPSERASGAGPRALRAAGVEVVWVDRCGSRSGTDADRAGALTRRARLQNQPFRKWVRTGRPQVVLKVAASMDGRVATRGGESRWITSAPSRDLGHLWRAELDAIVVGSGTAAADDPELTARPGDSGQLKGRPVRVVLDSQATLSPGSRLAATADRAPVIVAVGPSAERSRIESLRSAGIEVAELSEGAGGVSIEAVLDLLGGRETTSLLLEGGPRLAGSFADAAEVDEIRLFTAPLILGAGRQAVEGAGFDRLSEALRGSVESVERVGEEALVTARMREW